MSNHAIPVNLSSRKRMEWILYRHVLYLDDGGRGICECGEWSVMGNSRGTWVEHVVDLIEEAMGAYGNWKPITSARGVRLLSEKVPS